MQQSDARKRYEEKIVAKILKYVLLEKIAGMTKLVASMASLKGRMAMITTIKLKAKMDITQPHGHGVKYVFELRRTCPN